MKKILSSLTLLLLTITLNSQTTHQITLNVDTASVTKTNTNLTCNFGQNSSISNEDFTLNVNLGDIIVWEGQSSSSPNDKVEILSINHEGGARIFDKNVLKGNNGIVSARATIGRDGDSEKYTIKFRVYRDGKRLNGVFKIDPKIVIKQR